jgi:predicted nucleic acid-binding protein
VKASAIRYLIDAGPLVGAFSLRDQWHAWSKRVVETLDEPVFTTELVFGEACHLLKSERKALRALIGQVTEKRLNLIPIWAVHGARVAELLEKYPQMDAGDASLVVLSELYPHAKIITVDTKDFTVYRRFRDQRLPLIHP